MAKNHVGSKIETNVDARTVRGLLGISQRKGAAICTLISEAHDLLNKRHVKVRPHHVIKEIAGKLNTPSEIMYAGIVAGRHFDTLNMY